MRSFKEMLNEVNKGIEIYHGSSMIVEYPEIRKSRFTKDFAWGFYCTENIEQAKKWAKHKGDSKGIVSVYDYVRNNDLNILKFDGMTDEWLDFIAECRDGKIHKYDIVKGPMVDDTVWNFVNDYLKGNISREAFKELAKFKYPTHQISFHTLAAIDCLKFKRSIEC